MDVVSSNDWLKNGFNPGVLIISPFVSLIVGVEYENTFFRDILRGKCIGAYNYYCRESETKNYSTG